METGITRAGNLCSCPLLYGVGLRSSHAMIVRMWGGDEDTGNGEECVIQSQELGSL